MTRFHVWGFGSKARATLTVLATLLLTVGCGDDAQQADAAVCSLGQNECTADGAVIRSCINVEGTATWFESHCAANSSCEADGMASVAGTGAGSAGSMDSGVASSSAALTAARSGPACVGVCVTGEAECVTDALARVCVGGGAWQLDACNVGESCMAGACILSGATGVHSCEPDTKACASAKVEKVCDPDGTAWVERPCADNEACLVDECVADPNGSCDKGNTCIDNKTAIQCLGTDKGFEVVECPKDTFCEGGECRGEVCNVGSWCSNGQVRECPDGKHFVDTQCAQNKICVQEGNAASCVLRECFPGAAVCGDPRDTDVDVLEHWTVCTADTRTGVPRWVTGDCDAPAECDPSWVFTDAPCRQECTPKAMSCGLHETTGERGTRVCGSDGKWLSVKPCGTAEQCAIVPSLDASKLSQAVCAEPVCAAVFLALAYGDLAPGTIAGACDVDKLRPCLNDGTLGSAKPCATDNSCQAFDRPAADMLSPATCQPDGGGCSVGTILDCDDNCTSVSALGDGTCDSEFDCPLRGYDDGDCGGMCSFPNVTGCFGGCAPYSWLNDGTCDSEFDCFMYSYDQGDCGGGNDGGI